MRVWTPVLLLILSLSLLACGGGGYGGAGDTSKQERSETLFLTLKENSQIVFNNNEISSGALEFAISGGEDRALFEFDTSAGSFQLKTAPDFESPSDADSDNEYLVEITITSSVLILKQSLHVFVLDKNEFPAVPELSLEYGIKKIRFSWSDKSAATDDYEATDHYELLVSPDSVSVFTQVGGNIPVDTTTKHINVEVHSHNWQEEYLLLACNDHGCTGSLAPISSGELAVIGYLKASNTGSGDQFGQAIALSDDGKTLAVGAWHEDSNAVGVNNTGSDASDVEETGAVYVFVSDADGVWTQQAYIKASNTGTGDEFGRALALSEDGNTLVVGAPKEDSDASGVSVSHSGTDASIDVNAGAVYVFSRDSADWTQQAYIKASNTGAGDEFGYAVSLSDDGNTLAVGAYRESSDANTVNGAGEGDDTAPAAGAVYVYGRSVTTWSQQAYVKASNSDAGDWFGYSVSLSGDASTLAVGAVNESSSDMIISTGGAGGMDNDALNAGAVYIFTNSGGWSQQAYIKAANAELEDRFGESVSLSDDGDVLAVGSRFEDSAAIGVGGDATDDCDAGSPTNCASNSGAAYVFSRESLSWSQQAYIKASNTGASDEFGIAVALSGDGLNLIVGAYHEDSDATGINGTGSDLSGYAESGAAYLYKYDVDSGWSDPTYIKAPNTDGIDTMGISVAIDQVGSVLGVGANGEGSNLTGVNTGDAMDNDLKGISGAVYLY